MTPALSEFDASVGELFAGVGGFGHAAERIGMEVPWASEVEKSALKVLNHHFPNTEQLGSVTEVNARSARPVSILTGGSPCQGFSIAGVGLGLSDPRSGLFGEMMRVVEEVRPRWVVWENVPGVLTSKRGEDFANVLAALVGGSEPVRLPRHPNGRRGRYAGVVSGPRGTAAWRVLDAQHFGVAQRRRRIIAVLHLGGRGAGEVLHEWQGGARGAGPGDAPEHGAAAAALRGAAAGDGAVAGGGVPAGRGGVSLAPVMMRQREGKPGGGKGPLYSTDQSLTLATGNDQYLLEPVASASFRKVRRAASDTDFETWEASEQANTLNTYENTDVRATSLVVEGFPSPAGTLTTRYAKGINTTLDDGRVVVETETGEFYEGRVEGGLFYRVRRLTPLECERLQGFPDGWTLPAGSDSARYKAMGNAVAVPVAEWVLRRILEFEFNAR